jgi:hypothetical protein
MKADLNQIILNEILNFMKKENIPMIGFRFNGEDHYKPDGELTPEQHRKLTTKLKRLSTTEERLKILIKDLHGSPEKLDKKRGVSKGSTRRLIKSRLKMWRELLEMIYPDLKESITTK